MDDFLQTQKKCTIFAEVNKKISLITFEVVVQVKPHQ